MTRRRNGRRAGSPRPLWTMGYVAVCVGVIGWVVADFSTHVAGLLAIAAFVGAALVPGRWLAPLTGAVLAFYILEVDFGVVEDHWRNGNPLSSDGGVGSIASLILTLLPALVLLVALNLGRPSAGRETPL
jgi:hypothetical protein